MSHARISTVVDLNFGDSGKGAHVDYLCRHDNARLVVRFNGGVQAGHNVVDSFDYHYCFHQFGSGMLNPGVCTYLSPHVLVDIHALRDEAINLDMIRSDDVHKHMFIHQDCSIVTPFHVAANRIHEAARGDGRHGSCGMGIGELARDVEGFPDIVLRVRDLPDYDLVLLKLRNIQAIRALECQHEFATGDKLSTGYLQDAAWAERLANYYRTSMSRLSYGFSMPHKMQVVDDSFFDNALHAFDHIVFEGAQGVMLDSHVGLHPYTTWSNTTLENVFEILDGYDYDGPLHNYGLIRSYSTRHGPGPFPSEIPNSEPKFYDEHNGFNKWQTDFRVGPLDLLLLRYAIRACQPPEGSRYHGIDSLVISNFDRHYGDPSIGVVEAYHCDPVGKITEFVAFPKSGATNDSLTKLLEEVTVYLTYFQPEEAIGPEHMDDFASFVSERAFLPVSFIADGPTAENRHRLGVKV